MIELGILYHFPGWTMPWFLIVFGDNIEVLGNGELEDGSSIAIEEAFIWRNLLMTCMDNFGISY